MESGTTLVFKKVHLRWGLNHNYRWLSKPTTNTINQTLVSATINHIWTININTFNHHWGHLINMNEVWRIIANPIWFVCNWIELQCPITILQLDIFFSADQHIQIKGRNGIKYSMSEACEDIVAHEKLTDEVRNYYKYTYNLCSMYVW